LFLGVFLSAYFNIKWILGAFNNWLTVYQQHFAI
jgi:hypothetical protein